MFNPKWNVCVTPSLLNSGVNVEEETEGTKEQYVVDDYKKNVFWTHWGSRTRTPSIWQSLHKTSESQVR